MNPLQAGDDLRQYTVQAATTAGNGELKGSTGKTEAKHNYDQSLTTALPLGTFYFIKGDASMFKAGKPVTIKCRYCPQPETPPSEIDRLKITACFHDSAGNVIAIQEEEVVLLF